MKFPCLIVVVKKDNEGVTSEIFQNREEFRIKYTDEVYGYWFGTQPACEEANDEKWLHAISWSRRRVEVIDNAVTASRWVSGQMDDIRRYQYADLIKPEVIRAIPELFPDVADLVLSTGVTP